MNDLKPYFHDALTAFGRMSGWVAGPIVLALFVGKMLDKKYGTEPYIFVAFIGLGFFLSVYGIFRESKKYAKMADETEKRLKSAKQQAEEVSQP